MAKRHNIIRYWYWLVAGFLKKNIQLIFVSFIITLVSIIAFISLFPYVVRAITTDKEIIGLEGTYDYNNVPKEIQTKVSNSLIHINNQGEIIPVLADSWEQLDGGKEYRFYLKKGLTWSDGTDFTSHGLSYSFKDVEITKPDDYLIVFKLEKPLAIFPTFLTEPVIGYPLNGVAGLYNATNVETEFGTIKQVELTPNKPGHPIYEYKFYDSESKLIDAYKLGEVQTMQTDNRKIVNIFDSWTNTTVENTVDYTQLLTLFFDTEHPLLAEKDVREAIALGISKKSYEEFGEEAVGPIPPTSWAYYHDINRIPHNPDLSRKILEKYEEGSEEEITLTISTFYDYLPIAEAIQQSLTEIGIKTEVTIFSFSGEATFDMLLAFWRVPQDPDQYFFWHSTQEEGNITKYKNVKIDKLLEDGRSTLDIDERNDIYTQFQRVIMDDVPAHFLFYPYTYEISRK